MAAGQGFADLHPRFGSLCNFFIRRPASEVDQLRKVRAIDESYGTNKYTRPSINAYLAARRS